MTKQQMIDEMSKWRNKLHYFMYSPSDFRFSNSIPLQIIVGIVSLVYCVLNKFCKINMGFYYMYWFWLNIFVVGWNSFKYLHFSGTYFYVPGPSELGVQGGGGQLTSILWQKKKQTLLLWYALSCYLHPQIFRPSYVPALPNKSQH